MASNLPPIEPNPNVLIVPTDPEYEGFPGPKSDSPGSRRGDDHSIDEPVPTRNMRLFNLRKMFKSGGSCSCSDEMLATFVTFLALFVMMVFSYTTMPALALGGIMPRNATDNHTMLHPTIFPETDEAEHLAHRSVFPHKNISMDNVTCGYYPDVAPSPWWSLVMWVVCDVWQVVWLVCAFFSACVICKKSVAVNKLDNLFREPDLVYIVYVFSLLATTGWLFFFQKEKQWAGLFLLAAAMVSMWVCFGLSVKAFRLRLDDLPAGETPGIWLNVRIGLVRLVNHNGLAAYATWLWFATLVTLSVVVVNYDRLVTRVAASTVVLVVFFMSSLVWFAIDLIMFDRYTRYVIAPQATVLLVLAGVVQNNWNPRSANAILAVVLLGLAFILLCAKIAFMIYRHKKPVKVSSPAGLESRLTEAGSGAVLMDAARDLGPEGHTNGAQPDGRDSPTDDKKKTDRPVKKRSPPKAGDRQPLIQDDLLTSTVRDPLASFVQRDPTPESSGDEEDKLAIKQMEERFKNKQKELEQKKQQQQQEGGSPPPSPSQENDSPASPDESLKTPTEPLSPLHSEEHSMS